MIVNCGRVLIARAVIATAVAILTAACAVRQSPRDSTLRRIDAALAHRDTTTAVTLLRTRVRDAQSSPEEVIYLARILRSRASVLDRISAERVLQEGLRQHPDHADILVELRRTYYDQTFYGDAQRTFERVLSIDPDRCEAHYYLALNAYRKWKRVQSYTAYLSTTIGHLRHKQSCAAETGDGLLMLAFSEYFVGEMTLAAEACSTYASLQPEDPEPLLLLGTIAYGEARYPECEGFFREAMARLGEDGRIAYGDIELFLASDDEKERYRRAMPEQKATMQRLLWLDHDPDPTTEINERWLEHVYRVFLSETRFASDNPPRHGWETQRGKALIKFGPPDEVQSTLEGPKPHAGRMETWTYLQFPQGFSLRFEDGYFGGNYTVPIGDDFSSQVLSESPPLSATSCESTPVAGAIDIVAFRDSDTSSSIYIAYAEDDESLEERLRTWDIKTFTARTAFF